VGKIKSFKHEGHKGAQRRALRFSFVSVVSFVFKRF
jgi:hypothetical protein